MNLFLLIAESTFFLVGSVLLFRRERMYGIFFALTYVYAIFSQIGYLYFPELSLSIFAYFGEETWRPFTFFIMLSGLSLFLFLWHASVPLKRFVQSRFISHVRIAEAENGNQLQRIAIWIIAATLLVQLSIFIADFSIISWESAQQEDVFSTTLGLGIFILLIKLSVGMNLSLYCLIRQPIGGKRQRSLVVLFVVSMLLFLVFTFKIGNRTDDVAVFLGIFVFETSSIRLRPKHLGVALAVVAGVVAYLNFLESNRYADGPADVDVVAKVLLKDYYSPSHILFAAIGNDVVMPLQVLESNSGNALMFLGQPYLQAPVTDTFYPGGATRSASYGFYPFTEGYLFAGFSGFLYNGIVLGSLLVFWRALATTDSARFNRFLVALLGSMLVNLVRGQSSYYLKYLYTFVLPNALLYIWLARHRASWIKAPAPQ